MDLEEIRLKEVTELTEDDKKALNQNWTSLTEEEQEFFGSVKTKEDDGFKLPFKSQKELDDYVAKQVSSTIESQRQREQEEAEAKKRSESGEEFFPSGYKAKDWNEPFKQVVPKIIERVVKEIEGASQKRRAELDKINSEFDQELETIANSDPNLPKKGTKEREDWETEVAQVGQKYKLHTMADAFEVWKVVNSGKPAAGTQPATLIAEGRPATSLAEKVGRGYGTGTAPKKTVYKVGGGQRLDDLLEARKREEGLE